MDKINLLPLYNTYKTNIRGVNFSDVDGIN